MDIKKMIQDMTLAEKASLCSGADFWHTETIDRIGLKAIMVSDGPYGLRKQEEIINNMGWAKSILAVGFPTAASLANSFDRDLVHEVGNALGDECQAEDVAVLLGPGINMKRSPLGGRNFEYYSEDPYLAGEIGARLCKRRAGEKYRHQPEAFCRQQSGNKANECQLRGR